MEKKLKLVQFLFFLPLCFAAFAWGKADPLVLLNAPINGFTLPIFDGNGNRIWEIRGSSGTMVTNGLFHVKDAKLRCFSDGSTNGGGPNEIFCVTTEFATVNVTSREAFGESEIKIVGQNFDATADSWEILGDPKKIIAKNNVRVFLYESVEELSR